MSRIANAAILFGLVPVSACVDYPESVTDEDVLDQLVECQTSVGLLEENLGELSAAVEALQANDALQDGLLDEHDAELAEHDAELAQAVLLLTSSTTVSVSDANGLVAALDALDQYRLARDVTYTIELEDGNYEFTNSLTVNHPDGDRLTVVGASRDRDLVTLEFSGSSGIVVEGNRTLGYLGYVTLDGDSSVESVGIDVATSSSVGLGPLSVQEFTYGIRARENATITDLALNGGSFEISNCSYGIFSATSSYVGLYSPVITNASTTGIYAEEAGSIYAAGAKVTDTGHSALYAQMGSFIRAEGVEANEGQYGIYADRSSVIFADAAKVSDMSSFGIWAVLGSAVLAEGATSTNNGVGFSADVMSLLGVESSVASGSDYSGFNSSYGSVVFSPYSEATSNAEAGYYQSYRGVVTAVGYTASGNGVDFYEGGDGDSDPTTQTFINK